MVGGPVDHPCEVWVFAGGQQGGQILLGPGATLFSAQCPSYPRGPAGNVTRSHLPIEEVDLFIRKAHRDLLGYTASIPLRYFSSSTKRLTKGSEW